MPKRRKCCGCKEYYSVEGGILTPTGFFHSIECASTYQNKKAQSAKERDLKRIAEKGRKKRNNRMRKDRSSKITQSAKGENCSLRLTSCEPVETVVFAHIGKNRGMAYKCADYFGVYACSACHDIIDGRRKSSFSDIELQAEKLRALEETQGKLFKKGLISVV